uniref:glutathione transferase n=1 Tax=Syphacia muris TaxID=451379 RepID=A0A0N5ANM9_9BILA
MPQYKLTYFDIRGLGEGARVLFNYAGVPFEDMRIKHEEWSSLKPKMPYEQVPVLEVDGVQIAQSSAIYRYLGRQFNLVPKCPVEEALVDAVFDAHKDFFVKILQYILIIEGYRSDGDKDKLLKEVVIPARDLYFKFLTNHLSKTDGTHLIGKEVAWADLVIADQLFVFANMIPGMFDNFPKVKSFVDHIHQLPKIKKYFDERKPASF